jgi:hydrogenase expression/formation protein HypE
MNDTIKLAHGGGGTLMQQLIKQEFLPVLGNPRLNTLADSARLDLDSTSLAFTTDSFVVQPLIFPGGDIGKLAVCGTINDLAARGAKPIALSLALIMEDGLPLDTLRHVLHSIAQTAQEASVEIVTGDTKVVERGAVNGLFINTSGIGLIPAGLDFRTDRIESGDAIIISGSIGEHGTAVMSVREGIRFISPVTSDVAPLADMVGQTVNSCGDLVKCMKDPTRAGLAGAINEMAAKVGFLLDESAIPVLPTVRGACEILGLDVLTVANEGKMIFAVAPPAAKEVLRILRKHPYGSNAAVIGHADEKAGLVRMKTSIGGERIIDTPYGEELPRIC